MAGSTLAQREGRPLANEGEAAAAVAAGAGAHEHLAQRARPLGHGVLDVGVADDGAVAEDHASKATLTSTVPELRARTPPATRGYRFRPLPWPTYGSVTVAPHGPPKETP